MVQLWVNLPARFKMSPPRYQTLLDRDIPRVAVADGGGTARVIAGAFQDVKGPASTFTPVNLWDLRLPSGRRAELRLPDGHTTAVFALKGKLVLNGSERAGEADLALLDPSGEEVVLEAEEDATALVLSGEPIHEPVAAYGPFVMNTQEEIRQAITDFQSGRLGQPT
jgi:redox-sensitive bicupin YhaK (pirin superfamily)